MSEMGDNSTIDVDQEELKSFLQELDDKQRTVSEATGSLRSRIGAILDEKGWNKDAFATIRKIENKSETARADFLRTFEAMFDVMLDAKWRDEMHDMISDDEPPHQEAAE